MGAAGAINKYGALDTRQGRQGEMAHPEHEVRPLIEGDPLASALCHPLFEVKTCLFSKGLFAHSLVG